MRFLKRISISHENRKPFAHTVQCMRSSGDKVTGGCRTVSIDFLVLTAVELLFIQYKVQCLCLFLVIFLRKPELVLNVNFIFLIWWTCFVSLQRDRDLRQNRTKNITTVLRLIIQSVVVGGEDRNTLELVRSLLYSKQLQKPWWGEKLSFVVCVIKRVV